nr:MAG TPA: hypothetical protein [Caudoviricetes sp.]
MQKNVNFYSIGTVKVQRRGVFFAFLSPPKSHKKSPVFGALGWRFNCVWRMVYKSPFCSILGLLAVFFRRY